ncbi:hypothetical protein [Streptomyces roseoviridis]|uniref:Uncharacterized protein n=1 Tax=Streptomyces roseoviridis TaxID=67361 RepID=A0ABV5QY19_9ACTN
MNSSTTATRSWVVLGGVHHLNRTASRRPDDPLVLIQVPPQEVCRPATTVIVRWGLLGACSAVALTSSGTRLGSSLIDGEDLFPDGIAGPALRDLIGTQPTPSLVPLCYLAEASGGGYDAYAQIQFHPEDACFLRTSQTSIGHGPVEALHWLGPVLDAHRASSMALNNHRRYFRKHFEGTELEFKYTLDPAPDIWAEAMELLKALRDGELEDCRPEFRNEFQIHHTENHLFNVTGPDTEIGYASFIPTVTAGHVLKRKYFKEDSFARREELVHGIDVSPDRFETYLRDELGLQVRAMPPFQRVRYDIQCESMRTGHIYGIFLDRCALLAAPEVVLSQCELEYLRSRSVLPQDRDEVLSEMHRVDAWLRSHLGTRGWTAERTFYSKRSFLRDVVAARPDLRGT